MQTFTDDQVKAFTPRLNRFIPHEPFIRQAAFLVLDDVMEILYGGAAGGGKSDALLMAAGQYADVPGYNALILRKNFPDLEMPKALISRAHEWFGGRTDATWNQQQHRWTFHNDGGPATLSFGYFSHDNDRQRYASAEFHCICIDELTQFPQDHYRFMFSRLRAPICIRCKEEAGEIVPAGVSRIYNRTRHLPAAHIPLRMRSATNPGDIGHEWVKQHFVDRPNDFSRCFIPSKLDDNPYVGGDYRESLKRLDPIMYEQLLRGDWTARKTGGMFRREFFKDRIIDRERVPREVFESRGNRYWDFAATPDDHGDPDYTAGAKTYFHDGECYIIDIAGCRATPHHVENLVKTVAAVDGYGLRVYIEQEPGASGVQIIDHFQRNVLPGYIVYADKVTGSKIQRAQLLSAMSEAGHVWLVRGSWNERFLNQAEVFGLDIGHDDYVDATAGSLNKNVTGLAGTMTTAPLEI